VKEIWHEILTVNRRDTRGQAPPAGFGATTAPPTPSREQQPSRGGSAARGVRGGGGNRGGFGGGF
jgi:hypothetical protein